MNSIFIKAGSYVFIIILAYSLKRIGLFGDKDQQTIMKLIMNVTLPAAVISGFANYQRDISLILIVFLGLFMNLLMIGIGYLMALKKGNQEKAFNIINYSGYNIGTFTMPFLQSFLGTIGVVVACLYDVGNAIMCTGVTYAIASQVEGNQKSSLREFFRKIFSSVPFDMYLIMFFLYLGDIHLPQGIYSIVTPISMANPFLAMFMIGLSFEIILEKKIVKEVGLTLAIRYTIALLVAYILYNYLPFDIEIRKVLTLIVFAPMSTLNVISSVRCNGSKEKSGLINSLSILISLMIMTSIIIIWNS